jgi:hypothetical protein
VSFRDGTKLALFAYNNAWDDSITISPGDFDNYSLENAFITAGNPNGGFVNNLGFSKTDLDGNIWTFVRTQTYTAQIIINKADGSTKTINMDRDYFSDQMFFHCLVGTIGNDGYNISLRSMRPCEANKRSTSAPKWIRTGYINGVNSAYNLNYSDDVGAVGVGPDWHESYLRNVTDGEQFLNVVGVRALGQYATDPVTLSALDYYTAPANSASTTQPFLTLSGDAVEDLAPEEENEDPYDPAGDSEEGGGDGDFTDETEDIDFPVEPTLSAADTKFITLYNPSKAQLDNLASYMWSTGFDLDTFKKLFADPMQCILGLSIVPVNVPSGGTRTVTVGNISTGISMTVASKQYVTVDCGSINVKKYWGAYLDYDPYTKAEIYLPYIGIHAIAVDDIMGKSVHVLYRVDILSGACTAFVKCGGSVLYQFVGQCASSIPVTGNDWTNVINGALTIAGSIGTMVATGGASAPLAVGAIASTCTNSLKPNVEKSGSMGGTGGLMGGQKPYLILTRPIQAKPKNQNKYLGYPSFITSKVENLKGFTIFESIRLSNIPATEQEIEELSNLLESGVIL